MERKFEDGAMVMHPSWSSPRKVYRGTPDADGEIKVWDLDRTDWHYWRQSELTDGEAPVFTGQSIGQSLAKEAQPTNSINQEGTSAMANVNRSIVKVVLIDQDAGLDPSKALVKDFGEHVLEGSQEDLKMQIVMSNNMESILRAHNEVRAKEIDLDIRNRTGNEVKLQAKKLHELTWKIGTVA